MKRSFSINLWEKLLLEKEREKERERREILGKVLETLRGYFAAKKVKAVYLWGSILREGEFSPFSDIDIAVEDLKEDYFQVLCELEEVLQRDVDLVEIEKCTFRGKILQEGVKIL
ncbi:MAG: nucleotidyltransferase family protein [Candidatus Caldatribacteriaceae bacterium]